MLSHQEVVEELPLLGGKQIVQISHNELDSISPWIPLKTFHLFPKLPLEIRRQIWATAIRGRIIRLQRFSCPKGYFVDRSRNPILPRAMSNNEFDRESTTSFALLKKTKYRSGPDVLLSVCKESRVEVQLTRPRDICFSTSITPNAIVMRQGRLHPHPHDLDLPVDLELVPHEELLHPGFRFRPWRDTVYLACPWIYRWDTPNFNRILQRAYPGELRTESIQSLAVGVDVFAGVLHDCLFTSRQHSEDVPASHRHPSHSRYPDLVELIAIVSEGEEGLISQIRECNYNEPSRSILPRDDPLESIKAYISEIVNEKIEAYGKAVAHRVKRSNFPVFKVMTERMLVQNIEYKPRRIVPLLELRFPPPVGL